ncbi:MAG: polysaccharide biosynthesis/export family protein [Rhizomicrobium sp.]
MKMGRIPGFARLAFVAGAMLFAAFAGAGFARADDAAQPAAYRPSEPVADSYKIGTGDKLRITVFGEADLSGTFDVDGNGIVSLPLIGEVKVADLSASQAEQAISAKYADGFLKEPRINVEVAQYRPFYVIGQVNKPGEYPYVNDMSLPNAVALAGGYTDKAVEGGVYIRRNGDAKETYYDADGLVPIYPGDVVRVPASPFWTAISVMGPVAGLLYGLRL